MGFLYLLGPHDMSLRGEEGKREMLGEVFDFRPLASNIGQLIQTVMISRRVWSDLKCDLSETYIQLQKSRRTGGSVANLSACLSLQKWQEYVRGHKSHFRLSLGNNAKRRCPYVVLSLDDCTGKIYISCSLVREGDWTPVVYVLKQMENAKIWQLLPLDSYVFFFLFYNSWASFQSMNVSMLYLIQLNLVTLTRYLYRKAENPWM